MNQQQFREWTRDNIVILDGATGMNMIKAGMPKGVCPEKWIVEHPEEIVKLQKSYVEAGTNILYVPTFTANRIKLEEYGLYSEIEYINTTLVKLSREAAGDKALIAGDLSMTGQQLYPMGTMQFEELVDIYKEQIAYILMEGVDLFVIETMMSLNECRAALLAVKESCDLPVMVTLSFNEDNRTLYGTDPKTALIVLQSMGADAVGVNCSAGPDKMIDIINEMNQYATVPLIAKPNAGLPQLVDGVTTFDMKESEFAQTMLNLIEAGVSIVGGCCGTDENYIRELKNLLLQNGMLSNDYCNAYKKKLNDCDGIMPSIRALTTERKTVEIDINGRFMVVGERINPTGKKALQEELRQGKMDIVCNMAEEQEELGADILDINVGMNGIDEKETMLTVVNEVLNVSTLPLSIDSSYVDVIEAALRIYPGRALINSISLEKEKFERLIPIAKKYGAMFILLPLSDKGLPKDINEKKQIIQTILERAYSLGLKKEDIIVDGLVATVGANKYAALEVMETIQYCRTMDLATICGLSNISFGLPQRQYVNSTFLAFAIKEGLTMAIANPSQELLMNTAFASDLLKGIDGADVRYIERVSEKKNDINDTNLTGEAFELYETVVAGKRREVIEKTKKLYDTNTYNPTGIVSEILIPAINKVGELFEQKVYFLPQLISSAEAMKMSIDYLEPHMQHDDSESNKETIVIATVEGDIHDIGKNLVSLMLKNYGYNVIDLGKDVPAEVIINKAIEHDADIIALSALMTTTMMEMKKVNDMVKERNLKAKVIIGGAVVTQNFADEINADGYSKDAGEAVALVKDLLS